MTTPRQLYDRLMIFEAKFKDMSLHLPTELARQCGEFYTMIGPTPPIESVERMQSVLERAVMLHDGVSGKYGVLDACEALTPEERKSIKIEVSPDD